MRAQTLLLSAAPLALSVGCSSGPFNAPYTASISSDIDTIYVNNSRTYWFEDGIGAAIKMRILVTDTDEASGQPTPLENVWVEVQGPTRGVFLLPQSAIQSISYPGDPGLDRSECEVDGQINNSGDNEWCGWWVDENAQSYVQIAPSYAGAAGFTEDGQAYGPNYLKTGTDSFGRLEMWVFVDSLPVLSGNPTASRRDAEGPALDTGDTGGGVGGTGSDDGGIEDEVELGDALLSASIGHDTVNVTITAQQ